MERGYLEQQDEKFGVEDSTALGFYNLTLPFGILALGICAAIALAIFEQIVKLLKL